MKALAFLIAIWFAGAAAFAEDFRAEEVTFTSHGVQLSGSIVFPEDQPLKAAVVFVHGSGPQTRNLYWAERFASFGIAALVYDKRGVGASGGNYEGKQSVSGYNIDLLADDANAALIALTRHPAVNGTLVGFAGISQAGWIVPRAAENAEKLNFVLLWSGPVTKVSEEDIFSKYTRDIDGKHVPSYQEALSARDAPYIWPDFLGEDTDAGAIMVNIDVPALWIFGARDGSVPVDLSIERLESLIDTGRPFEYALFSGLGHNNMVETFSFATDWINRLAGKSE